MNHSWTNLGSHIGPKWRNFGPILDLTTEQVRVQVQLQVQLQQLQLQVQLQVQHYKYKYRCRYKYNYKFECNYKWNYNSKTKRKLFWLLKLYAWIEPTLHNAWKLSKMISIIVALLLQWIVQMLRLMPTCGKSKTKRIFFVKAICSD